MEKENLKYDALNFADYIIEKIGEDAFYKKISGKHRYKVRESVETSIIIISLANVILDTFKSMRAGYDAWCLTDEPVVKSNEDIKKEFVPFEERKALTRSYVIANYWQKKQTAEEMAKELNVPTYWVFKEIKRLGLQKKENGIKRKGRTGYFVPPEIRIKHQNQPHAKPVVQINPITFKVIAEFNSVGAVERSGFNRENVRRAIKTAGIHKDFLWSHKGFEKVIIKAAIKRGDLATKLSVSAYKRPSKHKLKQMYIDADMSLEECGKLFKCHKTTIAVLAMEYGLKKRTKHISKDEIEKLLKKGYTAKEIANKYNYAVSTIRTYISRFWLGRVGV